MRGKKIIVFLMPWVLLWIVASSCSEKMICPAYQSAFIYDTAALRKKFSYFVNDTPKIVEVNKTKFLLIEPVSYRKKLASFRTIEMLPIYPVIPDSLKFIGDSEMIAERDIVDSTGTVEEPLHPGLIGPKFNVEQENYMYYFRKILVLPDVRAEKMGTTAAKSKKKGFFGRLFGKKDKSAEEEPEEEKQGFFKRIFGKKDKTAGAESDEDAQAEEKPPKEKKSFFQRLKGKKKEKPEEEKKEEDEKKKAENEGF